MTYEEFKKKVDEFETYISIESDEIINEPYMVLLEKPGSTGKKIAWISRDRECRYQIDISMSNSSHIDFSERERLVSLITEMAMTPLEEREPKPKPKRYYVHVIPQYYGYLSVDKVNGTMELDDNGSWENNQTMFTAEEIDKLADENPDSLLIHFDADNPVFEEVNE